MKRFLYCILLLFACLGPKDVVAFAKDSTLARIQKIRQPGKQVDAYGSASEQCWRTGRYKKGLVYAKKGLVIAKKIGYQKGEADLLNHIGIIYDYQGEISQSLSSYYKALKIQEAIHDDLGIAYTCSNLGLIYTNQKNYKSALYYHKRSLKLRKKAHFKGGISASYNNIGIVYMYKGNYDLALKNYFESVQLDRELKDDYGLSDSYTNIGVCYMRQNVLDSADYYFKLSIPIREKFGDQLGLANSYNNLGTLYQKKNDLKTAKEFIEKGIAIGKAIGGKEIIKYGYQELYSIEERLGNYHEAFNAHKLYVTYGDSISNELNTRAQTQTEMQYKFDKERAKKEFADKKAREQVQLILWSVVVISVIILFFSLSLYKRWRLAKEQQLLIAQKNHLLELKNREILDSISYAKRIQSAILPPKKLVNEWLVNSFIIYKPKDIVAGDFYWMEALENTIIFAAADCTGHGVPGALISVVCHNALNRSVREFGLIDPGAILDKTRDIIIEEFAKSEDDVNDGMDISLCTLNTKSLELKWSGANNPLWLVSSSSDEVVELKANKQPIGKYSKYEAFDTHTIQLHTGDSIYLFTDGFADQFGGPGAKKYKSKNMKDLIFEMKGSSMDEQKELLETTFETWKGDLEQVDDVCILGIRV
ncbi:MAG: tetratricopeptide repeat protein [Fluviicola sp.]|nr:tetratricopeptide repeat protein [Fluviicola sp.]